LESGAGAANAAAQPRVSAAKIAIVFFMQSIFILSSFPQSAIIKSDNPFIPSITDACGPDNIALAFELLRHPGD
jgi:hypothetical protein